MKTSFFAFFAALVFLAAPLAVAHASVFEVAPSVSIPKDEIEVQNLYLAGKTVTISTTAQKDLTAAGGQVVVNGPVYGSVLAAGGSVEVLQDVQGSVRVAGGQVTISGHVSGDVLAAGGTVTIIPGSVVAGDIIAAGGNVDIEGVVNGAVHLYGNEITVNGTVGGPVSVKAAKSLTFGAKAIVGKEVVYSAPQEATVLEGAKLGQNVTFNKTDQFQQFRTGAAAGLFALLGILIVIKIVGMTLTALVAAWVFPKTAYALSGEFVSNFWKSALLGFVVLVVTPVACFLLALTAIGIYASLMFLLLYVFALILSGVAMCVFSGALLSKWIVKDLRVDWKWIIAGSAVVSLVWFIPFVGWIADGLLFFASLGVIVASMRRDFEAKM
jgi:hypothetical protein